MTGMPSAFACSWTATILERRPLILPRRRFVYPREAEEVERGALELLVQPAAAEPFLATCALGFADPIAPTGVWPSPNPDQLCAVAGGYAYLIDTIDPAHFEQLPYRPVYAIHAAVEAGLLLFVGSLSILAFSAKGRAWESPRLSDEGVSVNSLDGIHIRGTGWNMRQDSEISFRIRFNDGSLV